jgi:hypothetical protein
MGVKGSYKNAVPTGTRGSQPHHSSHELPDGGDRKRHETLDTNAISARLIALRILPVLHSVRTTGTQAAGRSSVPTITQE